MWQADDTRSFLVTLEIQGIDRMGITHDISDVLSNKLHININHINIGEENGVFVGRVKIFVQDTATMESVRQELKKIKGVKRVIRIND